MKKENTALAIIKEGASELDVKKALYNLMTNAETRLSDMVNQAFKISAFTFTEGDSTNKETGEVEKRERVVVIDDEGKTYHSMSGGLVSSFKQLGHVFGEEHKGLVTIDPPLTAEIIKKDTPKGHTYIVKVD